MSELEQPIKVVLIGESGVGKTSMISQFISNKFDPNIVTSSSSQSIKKTLDFGGRKSIIFDVWDTAGQENQRNLTKNIYKDTKAIILVYDCTNKKSFEEMKEHWNKEINQMKDKGIVIAIAGNKNDLNGKRQIENKEGEDLAAQINAIFISTSAKNGSGIKALFEKIGQKLLDPNFYSVSTEKKKKEDYNKRILQEPENDTGKKPIGSVI